MKSTVLHTYKAKLKRFFTYVFVILTVMVLAKELLPPFCSLFLNIESVICSHIGESQLIVGFLSLLAALAAAFIALFLYNKGVRRSNGNLLKQMGNELVHDFFIPYVTLCHDIYEMFGTDEKKWSSIKLCDIGNMLRDTHFPKELTIWNEKKQDIWTALHEMHPDKKRPPDSVPLYWKEFIDLDNYMELVYKCNAGTKGVYRFIDPAATDELGKENVKRGEKSIAEIFKESSGGHKWCKGKDNKNKEFLFTVYQGLSILIDIYDMKQNLTTALGIENALKYIEIYNVRKMNTNRETAIIVRRFDENNEKYINLIRRLRDKINMMTWREKL